MKCPHKKATKENQALVDTVMFVLNLVFLALLATSTSWSGIPRYIQGQWAVADENLQYGDTAEQTLAVEDSVWPVGPPEVVELVTVKKEQNLLATPESNVMKEQDSDEEDESSVWKIVLVVAILLVSIVGSVSMAYYLCVWRGGRIHYKPQKEGYA